MTMSGTSHRGDDRAISEVVGFILVFAVVLSATTFAATLGQSQIRDLRDSEQLNNAERGFELLSQNFDEIGQTRATARAGALDLGGGTLAIRNTSNVTVSVKGTGYNETYILRALQYRGPNADTNIYYEGGMVVRTGPNSAPTPETTPPDVTCREGAAIVSVVTLTGQLDRTLAGETVRIRGGGSDATLHYPRNRTLGQAGTIDDGGQVNVTVQSDVAAAWQNYFEAASTGWEPAPGHPGRFRCTGVERVVVRQTVIEVTFES